jgi:hypothetical protein
MTPFFTSNDVLATEETSAYFCLYLDNVGIPTRAIAVIGSQPIEIVVIGAQASNISASRIADVQILVPWNVTVKRTVGGHIQPVTSRTAYTVPVRSETAGGHIGRV